MRKILLLIAAVLGLLAVAAGVSAAAPVGPPNPVGQRAVQTDYSTCTGRTDATGTMTCTLSHALTAPTVAGDVHSFTQLIAPSGGLPNLPTSNRVTGYVTDNAGTPDDATDDLITGVTMRWFGHQMILDANGNYRLNVYAGPVTVDLRVTVNGTAYCSVNACS